MCKFWHFDMLLDYVGFTPMLSGYFKLLLASNRCYSHMTGCAPEGTGVLTSLGHTIIRKM